MGQCSNKHIAGGVVDRCHSNTNSKGKDLNRKRKNSDAKNVQCNANSKHNKSHSYAASDVSDNADENELSWRTHESRCKSKSLRHNKNDRMRSTSSFEKMSKRRHVNCNTEQNENVNNNDNENEDEEEVYSQSSTRSKKVYSHALSNKTNKRQHSTSTQSLSRSQSLLAIYDSSSHHKDHRHSQTLLTRILATRPGLVEISSLLPESVIAKTGVEVKSQNVMISHLHKCGVYLYEVCEAVHISHCHSCFIFIGPTLHHVDVESCIDCIFVLIAHSIQLRSCQRCLASLHVLELPILVQCQEISLTSFSGWYTYPELAAHLREAGISPCVNSYSTIKEITDEAEIMRLMNNAATNLFSTLMENDMDESFKTLDRSESLQDVKEKANSAATSVNTPFLTSTLMSFAESNTNTNDNKKDNNILYRNNSNSIYNFSINDNFNNSRTENKSNSCHHYLDNWAFDVALANVIFSPIILAKLEDQLRRFEEVLLCSEDNEEEDECDDDDNAINEYQQKSSSYTLCVKNDKTKLQSNAFTADLPYLQKNKQRRKYTVQHVQDNNDNNNNNNSKVEALEHTRADEMDSEMPLTSTQSTQIHRSNVSHSPSVATLTHTASVNNTTSNTHTTLSSTLMTTNTNTKVSTHETRMQSDVVERNETNHDSNNNVSETKIMVNNNHRNHHNNSNSNGSNTDAKITGKVNETILLDCSSIDKQRRRRQRQQQQQQWEQENVYERMNEMESKKLDACPYNENIVDVKYDNRDRNNCGEEEELIHAEVEVGNNLDEHSYLAHSVIADSDLLMQSALSANRHSTLTSSIVDRSKSYQQEEEQEQEEQVEHTENSAHVSGTKKYRSTRTRERSGTATNTERQKLHSEVLEEPEELVQLRQTVLVVRTLNSICTPPGGEWWETMWARNDNKINRSSSNSSGSYDKNNNTANNNETVNNNNNNNNNNDSVVERELSKEKHTSSIANVERVFVRPVERFTTQAILPFTFGANLIPPRFFFEGWNLRLIIFVQGKRSKKSSNLSLTSSESSSSTASSSVNKSKVACKHVNCNTQKHKEQYPVNDQLCLCTNNMCKNDKWMYAELIRSIELQRRHQLMNFSEQFTQSIANSKNTYNCKLGTFMHNSHQWFNTPLTKRCSGVLLLNLSEYKCTSAILQEFVAPTFYQILNAIQKENVMKSKARANKSHEQVHAAKSDNNNNNSCNILNNINNSCQGENSECALKSATIESTKALKVDLQTEKSSWSFKHLFSTKWDKNKHDKLQSKTSSVQHKRMNMHSFTASEMLHSNESQINNSSNAVESSTFDGITHDHLAEGERSESTEVAATKILNEQVRQSLAYALSRMADHKCVLLLSLVAPLSSPLSSEVAKTFESVMSEGWNNKDLELNVAGSSITSSNKISVNAKSNNHNIKSKNDNCSLVLDLHVPLHMVSMMQKTLFFKAQLRSEIK